jgi:thymidylate synthase
MICEDSFQFAWAKALNALQDSKWKVWNLVVQINAPELYDNTINSYFVELAKNNKLIKPNHVAHTIFPVFYKEGMTRDVLYRQYIRWYKLSRKMEHKGWGTYFDRMIRYEFTEKTHTDQLGRIIDNINNRTRNYGASHVMVIPYPHRDVNKQMGAPCLNYITVQVEYADVSREQKLVNLLAVYRNHDFLERAYGNYWGLCNLLKYIAYETNSQIGTLTSVSSCAYAPKCHTELKNIAQNILGVSN